MDSKSRQGISRYYDQKARSSYKARFDLLYFNRITKGINSEMKTYDLDYFETKENLNSLIGYT